VANKLWWLGHDLGTMFEQRNLELESIRLLPLVTPLSVLLLMREQLDTTRPEAAAAATLASVNKSDLRRGGNADGKQFGDQRGVLIVFHTNCVNI